MCQVHCVIWFQLHLCNISYMADCHGMSHQKCFCMNTCATFLDLYLLLNINVSELNVNTYICNSRRVNSRESMHRQYNTLRTFNVVRATSNTFCFTHCRTNHVNVPAASLCESLEFTLFRKFDTVSCQRTELFDD